MEFLISFLSKEDIVNKPELLKYSVELLKNRYDVLKRNNCFNNLDDLFLLDSDFNNKYSFLEVE